MGGRPSIRLNRFGCNTAFRDGRRRLPPGVRRVGRVSMNVAPLHRLHLPVCPNGARLVRPFGRDAPSPDELVLNLQPHRCGGGGRSDPDRASCGLGRRFSLWAAAGGRGATHSAPALPNSAASAAVAPAWTPRTTIASPMARCRSAAGPSASARRPASWLVSVRYGWIADRRLAMAQPTPYGRRPKGVVWDG
jgi:hypothetical protein